MFLKKLLTNSPGFPIEPMLKNGFEVHYAKDYTMKALGYLLSKNFFDKILFIDLEYFDPLFSLCKKHHQQDRMYLQLIESELIKSHQYSKDVHKHFRKIFTWNDDLVDNKKYLKYHFPTDALPEKKVSGDRKLICMVNANKIAIAEGELYSERKKTALFFKKDIDVYGWGWNQRQLRLNVFLHFIKNIKKFNLSRLKWAIEYCFNLKKLESYKGISDENIVDVLSRYKFCICYENYEAQGYITEKLFNCLNARCIPIYLGAININDYCPHDAFIDRRNFESDVDLYNYLVNMSDERYQYYIDEINEFLESYLAKLFSTENYINTLVEGISCES